MGLRPRFKTPLSQARDKLMAYAIRPLMVFQPRQRFLIGCSLLVLLTTLLLFSNRASTFNENYKLGDVLSRSIIAPTDLTAVDQAETERRKETARESTRVVFNFDSSRAESSVQSFRSAWEDLQKQTTSGQKSPTWTGEGGPAVAQAIIAHDFDETDLDRIESLIREIGAGYIYDDADADRLQQEIVLVDIRNPAAQLIVPAPRTRMTALSSARRSLEMRIANLPGWSPDQKTALTSALLPLIRPNLVLDQAATASAREAEAGRVKPVEVSLKRNQVVAREGDTVTPTVLSQITAIKSAGHSGKPWNNFLGLLLVVIGVYWGAWKFAEHRSSSSPLSLSKQKAFVLVSSAILVETALMRVGFTFGDSVASRMQAPFNDPVIWNFAIPFAAAALLVAMLVDTQLAFLTGIITALFAGMLAPTGMQKALFAMVSCSAAIYGIGRYRERQSVTLAGLLVGAINVLMAIALLAYSEQPLTPRTLLMATGAGIAGGLLTAVFAAGGLPINESFFGILTDVKLLELSNADLPVLGQLALRAPTMYGGFVDIAGDREPSLGDRAGTVKRAFGGSAAAFARVNPLDELHRGRFPTTAAFLAAGTEDTRGLPEQQQVRDACQAAGVEVTWTELPGGHTLTLWRDAFAQALPWVARHGRITP